MIEMDFPMSLDETSAGWNSEQRAYWLRVAASYDGMYASSWARRENKQVQKSLRFVRELECPVVLDIAAGTGLGHTMIRELNPEAIYLGLDISSAMLAAAHEPFPAVVAAMDELPVRSGSVDVVLCLFTSLSFASDIPAFLAEVERVLTPGGVAYLSVLSSGALSARQTSEGLSRYRTRGDCSHGSIPVHRLNPTEVAKMARAASLRTKSVRPLNALSGVYEHPSLWHVGRLLGRLRPMWSHSMEVLSMKPLGGSGRDD